jgi:predicted nucleic acid-binding protein
MSNEIKASKRVYWDSNIFLTIINEAPATRLPAIRAIFDDCDEGNIEVYTSILSIAEVAWAESEKKGRILDPDVEAKIDKLWTPPSPIHLVDVHQFIVFEAKALMRNSITKGEGWSLKPADAIHLATAKRMELNEFHTYEPGLNKYAEMVGFKICQPYTERLSFSGPLDESDAGTKEKKK